MTHFEIDLVNIFLNSFMGLHNSFMGLQIKEIHPIKTDAWGGKKRIPEHLSMHECNFHEFSSGQILGVCYRWWDAHEDLVVEKKAVSLYRTTSCATENTVESADSVTHLKWTETKRCIHVLTRGTHCWWEGITRILVFCANLDLCSH